VANLQSTSITGSFNLVATTANTTTCGYLWYNTSNNKLQYSYYGGSWSAGGALSTARYGLGRAGTQTASLAFGGQAGPTCVSCTESYNGTSWSSGGALSTVRYTLAGSGSSNTAALAFGNNSNPFGITESYNGTSWSSGGNLITGRYSLGGSGTNTAGLAFGGRDNSGIVSCTESYNLSILTCTP